MRQRWTNSLALLMLNGCGLGAPDLSRGHHLATVMGCTSCHGAKLDGHLFEENAEFALVWSSNLSRILPRWSDEEVERALRTGQRPNGSNLWFMPTFAQRRLSPEDMRDLVAWLRTVAATGVDHPSMKRGPQFAVALAHGFQDSTAQAVRLEAQQPIDLGSSHAKGRYLATIACSECHGPDLTGSKDPQPGDPPDLDAAAAYSLTSFANLLKTGITQSGHPAGDMAAEARKRLSPLDKDEVQDLHAYLIARAKR